MNQITKAIITATAFSLLLTGCDMFKKKDEGAEQKAATIEQIQAEKGKPAKVVDRKSTRLN